MDSRSHRSGIFIPAFALLLMSLQFTSAQWTTPRLIDTSSYYSSGYASPARIAIGPHREVGIVPLRGDTLIGFHSTTNGRQFTRTVLASETLWGGGYAGEMIGRVDALGFDSQSRLFVYWRMAKWDDIISWYSFRLSGSADAGHSFLTYWATPFEGGTFLSDLQRTSLGIDSAGMIYSLWDFPTFEPQNTFVMVRTASADSTNRLQVTLPALPYLNYPVYADIYCRANLVHMILSGGAQSSLGRGLNYLRSSDGGTTFSATFLEESTSVMQPKFIANRGGALGLLFTLSRVYSTVDSALMMRTLDDSLASSPLCLMSDMGDGVGDFAASTQDSLLYVAYTRTRPQVGVSYYCLSMNGGRVLDSMFLPGHRYPDIATDSLGGIYLTTVFQNGVYLTTRDVVLGASVPTSPLPGGFTLSQNYPNPFNPSTTISFSLPRTEVVNLKVYDVLGREVATLVEGREEAGEHSVKWNAESFASGVYFYQIRAGGFVETKRLLLLR
jgi:hypothetical protein